MSGGHHEAAPQLLRHAESDDAGAAADDEASVAGVQRPAFALGQRRVPGGGEAGAQVFHGIFPADLQREGGGKKRGLGHGAQAERFPGHDLQAGLPGGKIIQLPQTLLLPASGHHGGVVKGQIPAGENGGGVRKEALQFLLKPPRRKIVLTQHHHGAA